MPQLFVQYGQLFYEITSTICKFNSSAKKAFQLYDSFKPWQWNVRIEYTLTVSDAFMNRNQLIVFMSQTNTFVFMGLSISDLFHVFIFVKIWVWFFLGCFK